jgi:hypothetical protein
VVVGKDSGNLAVQIVIRCTQFGSLFRVRFRVREQVLLLQRQCRHLSGDTTGIGIGGFSLLKSV